MRQIYDPVAPYVGAGNLASYTFDFKIESLSSLLVVVVDDLGVEVARVRGDDTSYISSVVYDSVSGGGTVNLLANLPTDYLLYLILDNVEPVQATRWRNLRTVSMSALEAALDYVTGALQTLTFKMQGAVRLHESDNVAGAFNPTLPAGLVNTPNAVLMMNSTGTGFESPSLALSKADIIAAQAAGTAAAGSAAASAASAAQSAADALAAAQSTVDASNDAAAAAGSAAAAAASEAAVAADALAASGYATAAAGSAAAALADRGLAQTAASTAFSQRALAETAATAAEDAQTAAETAMTTAQAAAAAAAAVGFPIHTTGTRAAPENITAGSGVQLGGLSRPFLVWFVQGFGGAVNLAALSPQISAGNLLGQRLTLIGRSDVNTVRMVEGNGLALKGGGEVVLYANTIVTFVWDGTNWVEQ